MKKGYAYRKYNPIVICDMFSGVGAFGIKAAEWAKASNLRVVCNDINKDAYRYCKINVALNKLEDKIDVFNMDAREFIKFYLDQPNKLHEEFDLMTEKARDRDLDLPYDSLCFHHVYMHLPTDAIEYLDVFVGLFKNAKPKIWRRHESIERSLKLPTMHVYARTTKADRDEILEEFCQRIRKALRYPGFEESEIR